MTPNVRADRRAPLLRASVSSAGLAVRGSYFLLRRTASSAMKANENATASNTTVERISTITTPQERQCGARFADEL